ncbi:uncharacterized protein TNCV_3426391 [Trichonephila clavipes]|nr:uncharacterized protein TNCV_3426391 [Trichonephila clavipes]
MVKVVIHYRERKLLSGIDIFREGWESIKDDERSGRLQTSRSSENIEKFSAADISYPTIIRSAIRPVPHGPDLPIPSPPDTLDNILDDLDQIHISSDSDDDYDPGTNDPELFSQSDLNDLVRDLGLPKDTAEVLGYRLKERHLLNSGVSFSWYRFREKEFVPFFTQERGPSFLQQLEMFKIIYEPEDWRRFIDSSKRSLKAVLLHNGKRYASVSVGHSVHLKECYENLEFILNKLSYSDHK